ncbi:15817_t:CDS:10 [Funneliformis caledonium]|uniref:15817_t:CDS:1 n=1 Tax=Funneliformis caledonium TaxID=1117310 RepID=A0A9N9FKL0_9GLOM|nr:15817_t:CDS:10 [Funneliformis caledonium]
MNTFYLSPKFLPTLDKRVYIGGLSKDIVEKDLEVRLSAFGVVTNVDIIRQPTGECRGFAYITLKTTDNDWKKCVSLFNGAKWKGMTLKVQEAKLDYKQRLNEEWEIQKALEEKAKVSLPRKKRGRDRSFELAEDMSLVTDSSAETRKGWKKLKYGRVASVMRLKKDDKTRVTIDPSHYKDNLLKLSDKDMVVKPKSLARLPYFYEEYVTIEEKQQPFRNFNNEMKLDENKTQVDSYEKLDNESKINFASFFPKVDITITNTAPMVTQTQLPPSIIDDFKKLKLEKEKNKNLSKPEQSNLEALRQRSEEKRVEKKNITQALRADAASNVIDKNKNLSKQEQSNLIRLEALRQRAEEKRVEKEKITQALRAETASNNTKHIVFSDDDEQKNVESHTMNLFDSDESDQEPVGSTNIAINPIFEGSSGRDYLNLQRKFQEERGNQFDILKEIFGDNMKPEKSKRKETQWREIVHFDPDVSEAKSLEVQRQEINDLPISKDVKIEINSDLKGIFAPRTSTAIHSFSLFDDDENKSETDDMQMQENTNENGPTLISKKSPTITDSVSDQKTQVSSGPLFFFHFGDNELSKRSHFREMKIFMRMSPAEKIISHWQETSRDLTKEYKRKHKSDKLNQIKDGAIDVERLSDPSKIEDLKLEGTKYFTEDLDFNGKTIIVIFQTKSMRSIKKGIFDMPHI